MDRAPEGGGKLVTDNIAAATLNVDHFLPPTTLN